jgi:hypothetical protein
MDVDACMDWGPVWQCVRGCCCVCRWGGRGIAAVCATRGLTTLTTQRSLRKCVHGTWTVPWARCAYACCVCVYVCVHQSLQTYPPPPTNTDRYTSPHFPPPPPPPAPPPLSAHHNTIMCVPSTHLYAHCVCRGCGEAPVDGDASRGCDPPPTHTHTPRWLLVCMSLALARPRCAFCGRA